MKSASEGGVDEKVERMKSAEIKLFLVSDEGGTLKIEEVKTGPLKKSDLNNKVCIMVHSCIVVMIEIKDIFHRMGISLLLGKRLQKPYQNIMRLGGLLCHKSVLWVLDGILCEPENVLNITCAD